MFFITAEGRKERLELIYDREKAHEYRTVLDEAYSRTHHSHVITDILRSICPQSENKDFRVLDLGCGTGRYFKEFCNASSLTGIDISRHMIDQARHRMDSTIHPKDLVLQQADILDYEIAESRYDVIVSIGTLGEYCPLTPEVVKRITKGLRPGGIALLSVFDADHCLRTRFRATYRKEPLAQIFDRMQPLVPSRLRKTYSRLFYSHYLQRRELDTILSGQEGIGIKVARLSCPRCEWDGTHLVALMYRPPLQNERSLVKFDELLNACEHVRSKKGNWGLFTAPMVLSMAEIDHLLCFLSECGVA